MIWKLVFIVITIYAGVSVSLFFGQNRLVYFPDPLLVATPRDAGLDYEDVWLDTPDGVRLHGWHVPADPGRLTILFFHGNAGNISHRLETLDILHRLGFNTFIIDYRGYGHSTGLPSEQGTYQDARSAWTYLTDVRQLPPQELILFGRSLGGGVAAWIAKETNPGGLILESTFSSLPDMAAQVYPWFPVRLLAHIRYESKLHLPFLNCPVLIAHSEQDELIPFSHAQALFAAARHPKSLLRLRGGHNDGFLKSAETYEQGLATFLGELQPPSAPDPKSTTGQ